MGIQLTRASSYLEGIVRGYRNGLLTSANYANMTQCDTIDGE
jgi:V-type H+-transporting ATPase subunit d